MLHFLFLLVVAAEISVPAVVGLPMLTTELDRGIAMANVAATAESLFYEQAEKVYGQAKTLLPKINGLSPAGHSALETRMTDLRMALEIVPGATSGPAKRAPKVVSFPRADL